MERISFCLTAVEAIKRAEELFKESSEVSSRTTSMTLHFLGAESLEFGKDDRGSELMLTHKILFEGIAAFGVKNLTIIFIGPNLLVGEPHQQRIELELCGINVKVVCYQCLYHDYHIAESDRGDFLVPDAVLMLNAGIWGYTSWLPTLDSFAAISCNREDINLSSDVVKSFSPDNTVMRSRPIFLVTSYTLEEAEDDEDTIREYFSRKLIEEASELNHSEHCSDATSSPATLMQPHWLWESEMNPFRCLEQVERKSKVAGREYYSNCAWQCFHFPSKKSKNIHGG